MKNEHAAGIALFLTASLLIQQALFAHPDSLRPVPAEEREVSAETADTKVRVLFADNPQDPETLNRLQEEIRVKYGKDAEIILADHGKGSERGWLREQIEKHQPAIIVVRSMTNVFKKSHPHYDPRIFKFAHDNGVVAILRAGSGVDNIDKEAAKAAGITVARTLGNANSVGDLTLFLLAAFGGVSGEKVEGSLPPYADVAQTAIAEYNTIISNKGKWGKTSQGDIERFIRLWEDAIFKRLADNEMKCLVGILKGATIGILGYGSDEKVGHKVVEKLKRIKDRTGVNFTVIVNARGVTSAHPDTALLGFEAVEDRAEFFRRANIITIHLPGGEPSLVLEEAELNSENLMAIINTSRADLAPSGLIRQAISKKAEKRMKLAYFGDLDITPDLAQLMKDYPGQVVIIPHLGASTKDAGQGVEANTRLALFEAIEIRLGRRKPSDAVVLTVANDLPIEPIASPIVTPVMVLTGTHLLQQGI